MGEIQVWVRKRHDGLLSGSMLEVLDVVPGRRAITRSLGTELESRQVREIEPAGTATCRLTQHFRCQIPDGYPAEVVDTVRRHQRSELDELAVRLVEHFGATGTGN